MRVVIMGAAGDGMVVSQAIRDVERSGKDIHMIGFLDDALGAAQTIEGGPVFGRLDAWTELDEDVLFYPALHKVKQMHLRSKRIEQLKVPDNRWVSVIHPTAVIADDVEIGYGCFVASHVTIQPGSRIDPFVSIRAGANVGHDVEIGKYCYIGPNSTLSGNSSMAEGAHLGPNAVVIERKNVGKFAILGAGSVATKNIEEFDVCMGNPARKISSTSGILKQAKP